MEWNVSLVKDYGMNVHLVNDYGMECSPCKGLWNGMYVNL